MAPRIKPDAKHRYQKGIDPTDLNFYIGDAKLEGASDTTTRNYIPHVREFIVANPAWQQMTLRDVKAWLAEFDDASPHTALTRTKAVKHLYAVTASQNPGTDDPVKLLRLPKTTEGTNVRKVTDEEYAALLATCDEATNRAHNTTIGSKLVGLRDRAIIEILFWHGMRLNEVASLTTVMIDRADNWDDWYFNLPALVTKSSKPRAIRMVPPSAVALGRYLDHRDEYISTFGMNPASVPHIWVRGDRRKITPFRNPGIKSMLQRRSAEAGIHVTAHMFRRKMALDYLMNGGNEVDLLQIAGWADGRMAQRYVGEAAQLVANEKAPEVYANRRDRMKGGKKPTQPDSQ